MPIAHLVVCCVLPVDGDDVILYVRRFIHAVVESELINFHFTQLEGVLLAGVHHRLKHSLLVRCGDAPEHHGAVLHKGDRKDCRKYRQTSRK
jgi:hypothetical protein